ncbi:mechanosensitive ion channel family protein [Paraburkholderia strydomiana]|uniref:mechanosensitive ion channel family protein n=1 Tax=Paraburkholderia strydomiana TaxID=1245417 RepID=UPI0038BA47DE
MYDPLLSGYALVGVDLVIWRFRRPANDVARLLLRMMLFAVLTMVLIDGGLSPFDAVSSKYLSFQKIAGQVIEVTWWLIVARLLALALDTLLLPRAWRRQRLFQDVFGAVVFLAALVAAFGFVLELPVRGLVATSGALAIVLGLAIQSTLSDVFAGIVLNTTEPYHLGEWVVIDDLEGQVIEMNWRATHLLNVQGNIVIVPNAVAAKTKITNSSRPPTVHGIRLGFEIDPYHRPENVLQALESACLACITLNSSPPPMVKVKQGSPNSLSYEVIAYVGMSSAMTRTSNELFDLCHRHLAAASVPLRALGYPQSGITVDEKVRTLESSPLLRFVERDKIEELAKVLVTRRFKKADILGLEGDTAQSLSIVQRGVLSVARKVDGKSAELRRLGPGESFGELSVLANIAEKEGVVALTDGVAFNIKAKDVSMFIKEDPDFAKLLCAEIHTRDDLFDGETKSVVATESGGNALDWLLDKVRQLHAIKL